MSPYSAAPGTPQTPTKALVAGVLTFAASFVLGLWGQVQDRTTLDGLTLGQWAFLLLGSLVFAIIGGGATHQARNRPL